MSDLTSYFQQLHLPAATSHKGQNGKLLIIGGSELFHAASKWSLDIASKFVDMVFYSSVPSNNELIQAAKAEFWNGIVIPRAELENYIEEADCILIGPGMERVSETADMTNALLKKFPTKKWVIDAGALQMVEPSLLNQNCIITPHTRELSIVLHDQEVPADLRIISHQLNDVTVLLKGPTDKVFNADTVEEVTGGNAGMTKGGSGDVLAGLVAALYTQNDALTAAVVASWANKAAGDALYQKVGPFFNASDLVATLPEILWQRIPH